MLVDLSTDVTDVLLHAWRLHHFDIAAYRGHLYLSGEHREPARLYSTPEDLHVEALQVRKRFHEAIASAEKEPTHRETAGLPSIFYGVANFADQVLEKLPRYGGRRVLFGGRLRMDSPQAPAAQGRVA